LPSGSGESGNLSHGASQRFGKSPLGSLQFRQHFIDDGAKLVIEAYGV